MSTALKHATVGSRLFCVHSEQTICHSFKSPTHQTLQRLSERCSSMRQLKQLHAQIILHGLTDQVLTMVKLVSFCTSPQMGDLCYAQLLFDQSPQPNKFMYNHLIKGYSNSDDPIRSLLLYRQMVNAGISPNEFTIPFVLNTCACKSLYWEAVILHAHAIKLGMGSHAYVQNAFLIAYVACRFITIARKVFDDISDRTLVSWNSIIGGYAKLGFCKEPILLFRAMQKLDVVPDVFTLVSLLSVSSKHGNLELGRFVHLYIIATGIAIDSIMTNALIDMYAKCGNLQYAECVFDQMLDKNVVSWTCMVNAYANHGLLDCALETFNRMPVKNVVSWNSIICCHVQEGKYMQAVQLFHKMCSSDVMPNETILSCILSSCTHMCDLKLGRFVHLYIITTGIAIDSIVMTGLIDMYAKCGHLQYAERVFDQMLDKNVVSWTCMVNAYANHGHLDSALETFNRMPVKNMVSWNSIIRYHVQEGKYMQAVELFHKMCSSGVMPDETTLASILSSCSHMGDLELGKQAHSYVRNNNITLSVTLCNALIDMYAKCGALHTAMDIFFGMPRKDVVSWNVAIGALAVHGFGEEAIDMFEKMQGSGLFPDEITFIGLLSACSHCGLVETGRYYFDIMSSKFGISPGITHYACMVGLLGRGGLLGEAMALIKGMPMKPDVVVWGALLGACRTHGNLEIGKQIMKQLLELGRYNSGLYVLLSNMYSESQRWDDMRKIRKIMDQCGIKKYQAISSVEISGVC